jgi:aminoglycoside phosphotransferase (APT) family kinase protein
MPNVNTRPDLQVTVATAQAIVDFALADGTVATVSTIHGGDIAAVCEIAFVEPEPSVILKVYPDSLHWKMQKEVTVSALIQGRLSVAVPRILFADDTKKLLGLHFVLMTKLDGSILRELEPTLTSGQRVSAYIQIGQLLREFHHIPMEAFGYIGPNGIWAAYETNHAYMSFQFDRKLKEFTDRGGAVDLARRVEAYVAECDQLFHECTQPVLCHNDLHSGNLLAKTAEGVVRLFGVLDFEGALAGDPLMDVAKALYYVSKQDKCALLEGYGETGRPQWSQTLDLYHLYFVIELWCWMAQIGNKEALGNLALDLERFSTV